VVLFFDWESLHLFIARFYFVLVMVTVMPSKAELERIQDGREGGLLTDGRF